jgi:hypothetical protein
MPTPFLVPGDYLNVKDFGAVGDLSKDDSSAIQRAIDIAFIMNISNVYLPKGKYMTSTTVYLGYGGPRDKFRSVNIIGPGQSTMFDSGAWICPTNTDRPCLNIQGGRDCGVYGVGFRYNPMYERLSATINGSSQNFPAEPANWNPPLDPMVPEKRVAPSGLGQLSPFCAISIDAFTKPDKDSGTPYVSDNSLKYPFMTNNWNYPVSACEVISPSSRVYIENCTTIGFCVGIVTEPCGSDGNGDFIKIRNCQISHGSYGIAICHTQCRDVEIRNCNFSFLHTCIDDTTFGQTKGHIGGSVELCSTAMSYQFLNLGYADAALIVKGLHMESTVRIGTYSSRPTTFTPGITFEGCSFGFDFSTGSGPAVISDVFFRVVGSRPVKFTTCSFICNRFLVMSSQGQVVLEGCVWNTGRDYVLDKASQTHGAVASAGIARGYDRFGGLFIHDSSEGGVNRPRLIGRSEGARRRYLPVGNSFTWKVSSQPFQSDCMAWAPVIEKSNEIESSIHPAADAYMDYHGRRWPILHYPLPTPLAISSFYDYPKQRMVKNTWSLTVSGGLKVSKNPSLRFTETIDVGDVLWHEGTQNIYIVTLAKHQEESDTSDYLAYCFTAVQQNNYSISDRQLDEEGKIGIVDGRPLSVPLLDKEMSTSWVLYKTIRLPKELYFGDFTKGSTTVKRVHRGNGYSVDTDIPLGMSLAENPEPLGFSQNEWALTGNYLVASDGDVRIIGRKSDPGQGTGCELTLSKESAITGRLPIFPLPLVGINVQNSSLSARVRGTFTLNGSGGFIYHTRATEDSRIVLMPKNAAAAAIMGSSQCLYVSKQAVGSFAVATADGKAPLSSSPAEFEWVLDP